MRLNLARAIFILTLAFFAFFFALPILGTLQTAFFDANGRLSFAFIAEVFRNALYREGLENALLVAASTTLGCLLAALPLAVIHVRYDYPGKALLNSLILTPLILPPFVGAIGIQAILGRAGALNTLLSDLGLMNADRPLDWLGEGQFFGVVLMNVLHLYPILYLNAGAALANLDPAWEEAAANLGASPWRRFWRVTLPLIMPGVFAGASITFIWAFTELGVPLIFAYDRVTPVQIFNGIKDLADNPFPYALVTVLLLVTTTLYLGSRWLFERGTAGGGGRAAMARTTRRLPRPARLACTAAFLLLTGLAVLPHIGVVLLSVAGDWYGTLLPDPLTLEHYREALGHDLTLTAITNSLKYSTLATVLDLLLGVAIAYVVVRTRLPGRRFLDALAMLPLAVPGLVMAFGYLALSREGRALHPLMLGEDPLLLLVIAYALRRLPYVVRSASAGLQQVSPSLEEAAQNLGASPERALWRISLPLIAPNLIAGGLLAFSFAMLEVSDSMILAQQAAHFPITKAIYTLASALGDGPDLAAALGVWSMVFLTITLVGAGAMLGKTLGSLFRG